MLMRPYSGHLPPHLKQMTHLQAPSENDLYKNFSDLLINNTANYKSGPFPLRTSCVKMKISEEPRRGKLHGSGFTGAPLERP